MAADRAASSVDLPAFGKPAFGAVFAGLGVARRLIGRRLEVPVAQTAPSALEQYGPLPLLGHFADDLSGLGVARDRSERDVDHHVGAVLARAARAAAVFSVAGEDVALVLEVYQRPVLAVAAQNDAASVASVAPVGTAELDELLPAKMARAGAALARAAEYLHVVYEIGRCHVRCVLVRFVRGPAQIPFLPCGGGCVSSARRAKIRFFSDCAFGMQARPERLRLSGSAVRTVRSLILGRHGFVRAA